MWLHAPYDWWKLRGMSWGFLRRCTRWHTAWLQKVSMSQWWLMCRDFQLSIKLDRISLPRLPQEHRRKHLWFLSRWIFASKSSQDDLNLECKRCECNGNIDVNAIGNCDRVSGDCLRCVFNTSGERCDHCLPGYWGDALSEVKCHECECSSLGSSSSDCDLNTGECKCKMNVIGRRCDQCRDTYWNISYENGCLECKCNPLGSESLSCDQMSGQCFCRPGVKGLKCDRCAASYFNFTAEGCTKCECEPEGSRSLQCDDMGKCDCKENVRGEKCDQCAENFHNFTNGCVKCSECYGIVRGRVNRIRNQITNMKEVFDYFDSETVIIETKEKNKLLQVDLQLFNSSVSDIHSAFFKGMFFIRI